MGNEEMQVITKLIDSRQHDINTNTHDKTNQKTMPKLQQPMVILIMCQNKRQLLNELKCETG
jgi:hypothetical protein